MEDLNSIADAGHIDGSVDRFLVGVDVIGKSLLVVFLLEGNLVVGWVVAHLYNIGGSELKRLELGVKLHFVAIPRVSIGTDEVISVVGVGVAEVEVDPLHAVQMRNAHSDPRGQLLDLHLPLLLASARYINRAVLLRAGYSSIMRWLPEVCMLAFVGLWILMQVPLRVSEKKSLRRVVRAPFLNRASTSAY